MNHTFSAVPGEPTEITVRWAMSPDGRPRVLLQLPDAFVLLAAEDALELAYLLQLTVAGQGEQ